MSIIFGVQMLPNITFSNLLSSRPKFQFNKVVNFSGNQNYLVWENDEDEFISSGKAYIQKIDTKKLRKQRKGVERFGEYEVYRGCKRKVRYKTSTIAKKAQKRLERRMGKKFSVYECKICKGWHLFTVKKSKNESDIIKELKDHAS